MDTNHRGYKYYQEANDQLNTQDKRIYLARLTEDQKKYYNQYLTKLRQDRFKANESNKKKYNEIRKKHIEVLRETQPEKMAIQNRKDVKAHRLREKAKATELSTKQNATQTLTDAIRARRARAELKKLKDQKDAKNAVSSILNSIINAVPVESKKKKNRDAVAKHKAKKASGQPTRTYLTRSKSRTLNLF
jgi:hypothetical protein